MMSLCYQKEIFGVVVFMQCIMAAVMQGQQKLPVKISPLAVPSNDTIRPSQCPSSDSRQESRDMLRNITCSIIYDASISLICGPGSWTRVFYLNTSVPDQLSCPDEWNLVTDPVRGCAGANTSCHSAFSDDIGTAYSKVCGRIIGESRIIGEDLSSPDAFVRFISGQNTIEENYLDGVSVTHGAPGSRTHIWSFGAGHRNPDRCPCGNNDRIFAPLPLAEVGENYFCDRADELDPLWTGESCTNDNPCCSFHNPPYFSVQLPAATTDRIELRICTDEDFFENEPVLVQLAEIYVQ